jgi:hypothetical protein
MKRFLVSDYPSDAYVSNNALWTHIFERGGGEEPVRFVYDTQNREIVTALVSHGSHYSTETDTVQDLWTPLSPDGGADVQQDIEDNIALYGQEELVTQFGLAETDEMPAWADMQIKATAALFRP